MINNAQHLPLSAVVVVVIIVVVTFDVLIFVVVFFWCCSLLHWFYCCKLCDLLMKVYEYSRVSLFTGCIHGIPDLYLLQTYLFLSPSF